MEIIKELNGKKYIAYCCDRCGKIVEGVHTCSPNPVIEQLRQRVQELEKERADLMKSIHDQADRYDELSQELELSDALQRDKVAKLTAIPTDITQILDEVRKQERERCAALCEKSDRYRGDYFAAKIRAME